MTATVPAPRFCFACVVPKVAKEGCRYCARYKRPCGRHDTDHKH